MNKKINITVGIPAYNESRNIKNVICDVLKQYQDKIAIQKIIVVSDGSSDGTVNKVNEINDKRVLVIDNKKRRGKAYSENIIFRKSTTDYLIILDADIRISHRLFLQNILENATKNKQHKLICSKVISKSNGVFLQRMLSFVQDFKNDLFLKLYKNNKPIFMCNGRAMLYSKELYEKMKFPSDIIADDAYAGLYCINNSYSIGYANNAKIYFNLPSNLEDHFKQSKRFKDGQKQIQKYFDKTLVKSAYAIPRYVFFKTFAVWFTKNFIYMTTYSVLTLYFGIKYLFASKKISSLWEISISSK